MQITKHVWDTLFFRLEKISALAPAVAGLLITLMSVRWVFWFDSFTYLVSALLVFFATVPYVAKALARLSLRSFMADWQPERAYSWASHLYDKLWL